MTALLVFAFPLLLTLAELEKTKRHYVELYRATRDKRYELRAFLIEENIGRAREAARQAEREADRG